jgi:hypothetical protein
MFSFNDLHFALSKPQESLEEICIHPNIIWGIPTYSTSLFYLQCNEIDITKNVEEIKIPFLFHAIDFQELTDQNSKIPAFRVDFSKRASSIENARSIEIK